jgi:thymidylate synthase (FAD)
MATIIKQSAEFVTATPNIGEVIEHACRTCYKSHNLTKEGSAERLFNQIVKQSHHDSVCEHGSITMQIVTDRATMAQFTRHRIGFAYSIESQRYCNYSKNKFNNSVQFIKPANIDENTKAYDIWIYSMYDVERCYFALLNEGIKPETARSVLPNAAKTEMSVTGTVRAWRHFFNLRADGHAQQDIQDLCKLIHEEMLANGIPKYLFDDIFTV